MHPTPEAAIVAADFNGDGIADLAVANHDGNEISILIGKGDGTFRTAGAVPFGASPSALAVADFNGDGVADLAVANFTAGEVSILQGKSVLLAQRRYIRGGLQAVRIDAGGG